MSAIGTGTGDTTVVAAPGANRTLVLQGLTVTITTAAAQAFNIEDTGSSPQIYFAAPNSLAAGTYGVDMGVLGVKASAANLGLQFDTASAGVGLTVSGFGYIVTDPVA